MPDSKKLRERLEAMNMNQAELARKAGLKPSNLSLIMNKNRDVRESTLAKLCAALECKPEDIMKKIDEMEA